jgi:hypothetical protein
MRRLLVKLVALETALVGWLGYWLFLLYADNPTVAEGLAAQLSKFPQLAFTTVDISVLVIIGVLALFLAFKFQRGLKPGIRLERALQMLENLMKRNLILESQVAEMKLEKVQTITTPISNSPPTVESRLGSWERAFRTPIEAGPASSSQNKRALESSPLELGSEREPPASRSPAPRFEPKTFPQTTVSSKTPYPVEKNPEKTGTLLPKILDRTPTSTTSPAGPATWEDSPKYLGETGGFLTPSPTPRRQTTSSQPEATRQPYIPVPPPRVMPSSVILGPGVSSIPQARPLPRPGATVRVPQKAPLVLPTPPPTSLPPTLGDNKPSTQELQSETTQHADTLKAVIPERNQGDNSTKSDLPESSSISPASSETPPSKTEPKTSGRLKKRTNWEDE